MELSRLDAHRLKWRQQAAKYRAANRDTHLAYRRKYYKRMREQRPAALRDSVLRGTYGIGIEDYQRLLATQNGRCAICHKAETSLSNNGKDVKPLAVDHDHLTGRIRGLLCTRCNVGVGYFANSESLLTEAITYLRKAMET